MSRVSSALNDAISAFEDEGKGKVTPEMTANLRSCIESSPELAEQMNRAVAEGHLKQFALMKTDGIAGGMYDGEKKAILLSSKSLTATLDRAFDIRDVAFVLGHETQHGFNRVDVDPTLDAIRKDMRRIARDPNDDDYDPPMEAWQGAARVDEAKASLAGWNAAVSQHRQSGGEMTLEAMFKAYTGRAKSFVAELTDEQGRVTGYELKDGISLRGDMTADVDDPSNVAALGRHYYDDPLRQVGPAKADYTNYTGTTVLKQAVEYEGYYESDRMTLNFARFGLSEESVERNGISVGKNAKADPYHVVIDTSHGMAVERRLHHTIDDTVSADWVNQHVPITPARQRLIGGFDDPTHPEHDLYKELAERLPPGTSPDRLAQITQAASRGGIQAGELSRVDITDTGVYLTGAIPGDRAVVDLNTPPPPKAESEQQHAQFAEQRQAMLQQQWQQMEQQAQQQGHGLSR